MRKTSKKKKEKFPIFLSLSAAENLQSTAVSLEKAELLSLCFQYSAKKIPLLLPSLSLSLWA